MEIVAKFTSVEEMQEFINTFGGVKEAGVINIPEPIKPVQEVKKEGIKKETPKKAKEEPKKKDEPKEETKKEESKKEETPTVKREDVRTAFANLVKAGKQKEAKEIISSFGANKVSEIVEENYAEAVQKAKEAM